MGFAELDGKLYVTDTEGEQGLDRALGRLAVGLRRHPGALGPGRRPDDPGRLGHQRGEAGPGAGARTARSSRSGTSRRLTPEGAGGGPRPAGDRDGRGGAGPRAGRCPTRRPRPSRGGPSAGATARSGPTCPTDSSSSRRPGRPKSHVALALGPKGELAVVDQNRLLVFDEAGHYLLGDLRRLRQQHRARRSPNPERVYDTDGRRSLAARSTRRRGCPPGGPRATSTSRSPGDFLGDFAPRARPTASSRSRPAASPTRTSSHAATTASAPTRLRRHLRHEDEDCLHPQGHESRRPPRRERRRRGRDKAPDGQAVRRAVRSADSLTSSPTATSCSSRRRDDQWGTLWHPSRDADGTPGLSPGGPAEAAQGRRRNVLSPYTHKLDPIRRLHLRRSPTRGGALSATSYLNRLARRRRAS